MVRELQTIKELGFNLLRKHAKSEPQRWYYHCDKLGLIVWQDMVNLSLIHSCTISSETLMATAADSRNDVLTTGAVLISTVICSLTGWARLDGIMGVALSLIHI